MVRTQIQLTEEQWKALRRLAAEKNVSLAELVRQGVDVLLRSSKETGRRERWRRAHAAVGRHRSGKGDLARKHDKYAAEAFDS